MTLKELVFREVNVVLVHGGIAVPAISLDRVRAAHPSSNMQVTSGPGALTVIYPDERVVVQFDPQRITANDTSTRGPEVSQVVEMALAQHTAVGNIPVVAFGYNLRFDFEIEGMDQPAVHLARSLIRDPAAVAGQLRTEGFQAGFGFTYQRGVKLWSLRMDPVSGFPNRLGVHTNVHEDLKPRPSPETPGPPPPAWLQEGEISPSLPSLESMKADLALQTRMAMETVAGLLTLAA